MKSDLFILYYLASDPNHGSLNFLKKQNLGEEGIPIGQLFFWLRGVWSEDSSSLASDLKDLYLDLMGVNSMDSDEFDVVGPFQNIEEVRRFSYLFCQKLNYKRVCLFSVDDLNEILKFSNTREGALKSIVSKADTLENLDVSKSKSFFDRILTRK